MVYSKDCKRVKNELTYLKIYKSANNFLKPLLFPAIQIGAKS